MRIRAVVFGLVLVANLSLAAVKTNVGVTSNLLSGASAADGTAVQTLSFTTGSGWDVSGAGNLAMRVDSVTFYDAADCYTDPGTTTPLGTLDLNSYSGNTFFDTSASLPSTASTSIGSVKLLQAGLDADAKALNITPASSQCIELTVSYDATYSTTEPNYRKVSPTYTTSSSIGHLFCGNTTASEGSYTGCSHNGTENITINKTQGLTFKDGSDNDLTQATYGTSSQTVTLKNLGTDTVTLTGATNIGQFGGLTNYLSVTNTSGNCLRYVDTTASNISLTSGSSCTITYTPSSSTTLGFHSGVGFPDTASGYTMLPLHLKRSGTAMCFGDNQTYQTGTSTSSTDNVTAATSVLGLGGTGSISFDQIAAGSVFSCGLASDGKVYCWGSDDLQGQLGLGTTGNDIKHPTTNKNVTGITTATQVAVGTDHACALLSNGTVKCWGSDVSKQLGDGVTRVSPNDYSATPVTVKVAKDGTATPITTEDLSNVKQISADGSDTCAVLGSGDVVCWGLNDKEQLGNGLGANANTAVGVMGLDSTMRQVVAGYNHTCAVSDSGKLYCWGSDDEGQVGDQLTGLDRTVKRAYEVNNSEGTGALSASDKVISAAINYKSTCVILSTGLVKCWGDNASGQLGDGGTLNSTTAVTVIKASDSSDLQRVDNLTCSSGVSLGDGHCCATNSTAGTSTSNRGAYNNTFCWGGNASGQLGDSNTIDLSSATAITSPGSGGVTQLSSSYVNTCLLRYTS